ncbi:MAG: class I SAM-dependent methyltransferase [Solirubrobacterales bacterium]
MSPDIARRFDAIYAGSDDPWAYETSEYEAAKYRSTIAALPARRIRNALEMGCSIGVFTGMLAERCDRVVAADFSPLAVERARARLADRPNVELEQRDLRGSLPDGPFDLVVCSEVLYYWQRADVEATLDEVESRLDDDGCLVAVNWRGVDPEAPLRSCDVEAIIDAREGFRRVHSEHADGYRLGRWERTS